MRASACRTRSSPSAASRQRPTCRTPERSAARPRHARPKRRAFSFHAPHGGAAPEGSMEHKYDIGAHVHFEGGTLSPGARGVYKVTRQLPVERDNRLIYRIKSAAETLERTAEEHQLRR